MSMKTVKSHLKEYWPVDTVLVSWIVLLLNIYGLNTGGLGIAVFIIGCAGIFFYNPKQIDMKTEGATVRPADSPIPELANTYGSDSSWDEYSETTSDQPEEDMAQIYSSYGYADSVFTTY